VRVLLGSDVASVPQLETEERSPSLDFERPVDEGNFRAASFARTVVWSWLVDAAQSQHRRRLPSARTPADEKLVRQSRNVGRRVRALEQTCHVPMGPIITTTTLEA
jgi:hypothetical protein